VPKQGDPDIREAGQADYGWRWDRGTDYRSETQRNFGGHGILIGEAFCFFDDASLFGDATLERYKGRMQTVTLH